MDISVTLTFPARIYIHIYIAPVVVLWCLKQVFSGFLVANCRAFTWLHSHATG